MSSSNNSQPARHDAAGGAKSYLFPDISATTPPAAENVQNVDDFHISHFHVDGGGFYGLMRHREKQRENPEAVVQAAKIKAEAIEKQAYDNGLARAEADARALVEKDFETLFAALNKGLSELDSFKRALEVDAERDAVKLAFAIARKIVYHEISSREETIFEVIHEALRQVPDRKSATIRVSPADYERIKARAAAFSNDEASLEEMRMAPDQVIQDGDCIIDTPFGMIDARIDKRLQAVESALKSRLK